MDVTVKALLERMHDGDSAALDELLPIVYQELRRLAHAQRRKHSLPSETLNTTALVHEVYLRLGKGSNAPSSRDHLFAIAATAMRQLLVDEARKRASLKRGSGKKPVSLDEVHEGAVDLREDAELLLEMDQALVALEETNPRLRRVVECRFFGGLTEEETARALDIGERTVRRDWFKAKAWLKLHLESGLSTA